MSAAGALRVDVLGTPADLLRRTGAEDAGRTLREAADAAPDAPTVGPTRTTAAPDTADAPHARETTVALQAIDRRVAVR